MTTRETFRILVINPGSTSTKIAVFEDEDSVWSTNISHSEEQLARFDRIIDEHGFREDVIEDRLVAKGDTEIVFRPNNEPQRFQALEGIQTVVEARCREPKSLFLRHLTGNI